MGRGATPRWLSPERAVTFHLDTPLTKEEHSTHRSRLAADQIDIFCLPVAAAPPRLFLSDMDSTVLVGETLDDLAARAGIRDQVAAITARAMDGTMDYRESFAARLSLLKPHITTDDLDAVLAQQRISAGVGTLIATLKAHDVITALVSGGFNYFTERISPRLGFDNQHGNTLDLDQNGQITGKLVEPFVHHVGKLNILNNYARDMDISTAQIIALGDGANDIPMLRAAGLGVAYRPKPAVSKEIPNQILYGDLTALLYAVGYADNQIVRTSDPDIAHD